MTDLALSSEMFKKQTRRTTAKLNANEQRSILSIPARAFAHFKN